MKHGNPASSCCPKSAHNLSYVQASEDGTASAYAANVSSSIVPWQAYKLPMTPLAPPHPAAPMRPPPQLPASALYSPASNQLLQASPLLQLQGIQAMHSPNEHAGYLPHETRHINPPGRTPTPPRVPRESRTSLQQRAQPPSPGLKGPLQNIMTRIEEILADEGFQQQTVAEPPQQIPSRRHSTAVHHGASAEHAPQPEGSSLPQSRPIQSQQAASGTQDRHTPSAAIVSARTSPQKATGSRPRTAAHDDVDAADDASLASSTWANWKPRSGGLQEAAALREERTNGKQSGKRARKAPCEKEQRLQSRALAVQALVVGIGGSLNRVQRQLASVKALPSLSSSAVTMQLPRLVSVEQLSESTG